MYYLIDLERTIGSGHVHYWKANKMGYTMILGEAGEYSKVRALEIVSDDYDNRTIMVEDKVITKILEN